MNTDPAMTRATSRTLYALNGARKRRHATMHWHDPPRRKIPVLRISTYLIGIVITSFVLAHFVGLEMTRDGERPKERHDRGGYAPSIPGPLQGDIQP